MCFEYIYNSVKDTPSEFSFLSILQHLVLIRDDFQVRYAYFRLIEECVARIALHKDGRDPDVARFVCASADGLELVERVENLLRFSLPQFQQEGKLYVTVAVGCTGGRHRSVAIVEELRRRLGGEWDILIRHRDVDRGE